MNSEEKIELLKPTIFHLYSKEGRSKNYISKLLEINRNKLSSKIKEWELEEAEPRHHFTPSMQKFVNKNRGLIKARLDCDTPIGEIAKEIGISRDTLQKTIIPNDIILDKARNDYVNRRKQNASERRESIMSTSSRNYISENLQGEIWKPILGYDKYMVSNKGRVKGHAERYDADYIVVPEPNKNNGRLYVMLYSNGERKNLQLARLVAHAFVDGYSDKRNTVNHIDGNIGNNDASNLNWVSQSENNIHSYRTLGRKINARKRYEFSKIVYKGRYEFKTIAALARFLNKSETQVRRYIDNAAQHEIQLVT